LGAGVWVIAETSDLTKFAKVAVTDDHGRYVLPELAKASYQVWVRGYGLVDSPKVQTVPGKVINLIAVTAPDPAAAAEYYPAIYWYSMLKVPDPSEFAGTGLDGNGISAAVKSQAQWLDIVKTDGCYTCHQLGNKATRAIPKELGQFNSSMEAWARRIVSGQAMTQGPACEWPSRELRPPQVQGASQRADRDRPALPRGLDAVPVSRPAAREHDGWASGASEARDRSGIAAVTRMSPSSSTIINFEAARRPASTRSRPAAAYADPSGGLLPCPGSARRHLGDVHGCLASSRRPGPRADGEDGGLLDSDKPPRIMPGHSNGRQTLANSPRSSLVRFSDSVICRSSGCVVVM